MEEDKRKEPKVRIHITKACKETDDECFDYASVSFDDWSFYVWGCKDFTSTLTSEEGSLIKDAVAQISDLIIRIGNREKLPEKGRTMKVNKKSCTEERLEEIANDSLKSLMEVVDINLIRDQMSSQLWIDLQKPEEEEKYLLFPECSLQGMNRDPMNIPDGEPENTNIFWPERQMNESLLKRKKGQHLSDGQILHITKQLERSPKSGKLLQKRYKLSQSTLRRISQQQNKGSILENCPLTRLWKKKRISKEAELAARSYLLPPWEPKSITMVQRHIKSNLGEVYSTHEIRNYIKNVMKYSYKKGNSRPPVYVQRGTQLRKALFCTELLSLIANGEVIINCDESSFDRSVRQQHSWLPVGQSCQIINDWLKGRASLILATWNTGEWLAMIVMSTINSYKFWFFLKLLSVIIRRHLVSIQKSPVIVIDNASTHSSGLSQEIIESLDLKVKFMAPYWPEVAPVERIFGKLKSKLRSMGGSMTINFNKLKGAELIFKLINSIDTSSWYKAWKVVIIEARKSIAEILVKKSISNELNWRDNQIPLGLLSLDNTKDADKTSSI